MIQSGMVRYHDDLKPLLHDIDSVEPHPENYNNGDVDEIATSIQKIGMYGPIKVQRSTGYIVAGNHTWMACKMLNATQVPIVYADLDDEEAISVLVRDNELARAAKPDHYQLVQLLDRIKTNEGNLEGVGRTEQDLENLRKLIEIPVEYDEYGQWPTLTIKVPPHVRTAFYRMTDVATDERERFELLLRMAGWEG